MPHQCLRNALHWLVFVDCPTQHLFPTYCHPPSSLHHPYLSPSFVPQMLRARKAKAGTRHCSICQKDFHAQAFTSHFKKCKQVKKAKEGLDEYECSIREKWYSEPTCMCLFMSLLVCLMTSFQRAVASRMITSVLMPILVLPPPWSPQPNLELFLSPLFPCRSPFQHPMLVLCHWPTSLMVPQLMISKLSIILGAIDLPRSVVST